MALRLEQERLEVVIQCQNPMLGGLGLLPRLSPGLTPAAEVPLLQTFGANTATSPKLGPPQRSWPGSVWAQPCGTHTCRHGTATRVHTHG